ncbi:hypothetical protein BCR43DRAFT_496814 [Syncephalastrum racemosum]|uniref:Homeobox domain-containing protein n=1 Tax=Syncephalastrum racemosum TaxID=13706 RepID=A0A1X2H4P4_SYNRA|nr:hypothetical protein BCR43DRAFT_496814 [Syncephalastrum racemosum]
MAMTTTTSVTMAGLSALTSHPGASTAKGTSNNNNLTTAEINGLFASHHPASASASMVTDIAYSTATTHNSSSTMAPVSNIPAPPFHPSATTSGGASASSSSAPTSSSTTTSTTATTQQQSARKRTRTTPEQLSVLEKTFSANPSPNGRVREQLSKQLGMTERSIQIWFQNRRAKEKNLAKRSSMAHDRTLRMQQYAATAAAAACQAAALQQNHQHIPPEAAAAYNPQMYYYYYYYYFNQQQQHGPNWSALQRSLPPGTTVPPPPSSHRPSSNGLVALPPPPPPPPLSITTSTSRIPADLAHMTPPLSIADGTPFQHNYQRKIAVRHHRAHTVGPYPTTSNTGMARRVLSPTATLTPTSPVAPDLVHLPSDQQQQQQQHPAIADCGQHAIDELLGTNISRNHQRGATMPLESPASLWFFDTHGATGLSHVMETSPFVMDPMDDETRFWLQQQQQQQQQQQPQDSQQQQRFSAETLQIGSWKRVVLDPPNDMSCLCDMEQHQLVWTLQDGNNAFKMVMDATQVERIVWSEFGDHARLAFEFSDGSEPQFYMRSQHEQSWIQCRDFTQDKQATTHKKHWITGSAFSLWNEWQRVAGCLPDILGRKILLDAINP